MTPLVAALVTPRLALRGWRFTCYVFAGAAAVATFVWQSLASNSPAAIVAPSSYAGKVAATASSMAAAASAAAAQGSSPTKRFEAGGESWTWVDGKGWAKKPNARPKKAVKAVEWGIFKLASVRTRCPSPQPLPVPSATQALIQVKAMVVYWTAFGNINYTHLNLAPTFYMEKFGCTPLQFGNYLAIVNSTNIPLTFVSGAIETILLNRGAQTIADAAEILPRSPERCV